MRLMLHTVVDVFLFILGICAGLFGQPAVQIDSVWGSVALMLLGAVGLLATIFEFIRNGNDRAL